ncbi:MAG: hypothetical protein V1827_00645 [Candidatus Micrarchaeota archaeon]
MAVSKKKAKAPIKAPKANKARPVVKKAKVAVKTALKAKTSAPKAKPALKAKLAPKAVKAVKGAKKDAKSPKSPIQPPAPEIDKEAVQKEILQKVVKILSDSGVRQNLIELGGENALAIVRNFYGNCSDEDLAKKLKIKISDVRATLNKLHNEGLVNYIREKDSETGWYSYSWSLNHNRMERWASTSAPKLKEHAGGEDYYFCSVCGSSSVMNFESAANLSFRCDRCNRLLDFIDEKKMLELSEKK